MSGGEPFFEFRGVYECGWNLFIKKGYSDKAEDVGVNYAYIDHLAQAGINRLIVFWANGPGYRKAWEGACGYAHERGVKLIKGLYGFCGGGPEHEMNEPGVPERLLRPSGSGAKNALCPFEPEAREWMKAALADRLYPSIDGISIEPAQEIGKNCACPRCEALLPYGWEPFAINLIAAEIKKIKGDAEIILHMHMNPDLGDARILNCAAAMRGLDAGVRHIISWGVDDDARLALYLSADRRFEHFGKLGRMRLFPGGAKPEAGTAYERAASVFDWCRASADAGKRGYVFDYRIFGGSERQGCEGRLPVTRITGRLPASLALIGMAMREPRLSRGAQREFLDGLRAECFWDIDEPELYYRGAAS